MKSKLFLLFFMIILTLDLKAGSGAGIGSGDQDSFKLTFIDQRTIVEAPPLNIQKSRYIMLENRTLSNINARLINEEGQFIKAINIPSNSDLSVEQEIEKNKKFYILPMAPAGQELELKIGKTRYELPAN